MENGEWEMSDDEHSQLSTLNSPLIPPGYKQTEVGVIPKDWEVKQIQEVCGFIVPGRNKPKVFDGNIPWITTPDLEDGRTVYESRSMLRVSINEAKVVGSKVVPAGSVLMSCVGELGIVALAGCDIVINQQLHAFLPSAAINSLFLAYAIKSQAAYIDSVATKTALPYLNKDNCNSIPIPVPSLPEQEAIAEALNDADALIESLEQLIAKKREIKQGAMQALLTGKNRLPGFTGEWKVKQIQDISDVDPENLSSDVRHEYAFKYISLEQIDRGTLKGWTEQVFATAPSRARRKIRKGDVLVSTVRPNLQSHCLIQTDLDDLICSTGFAVIRCRPGVAEPYYVFTHFFASFIESQLEALVTGSNYPAINSSDVKCLKILVPPTFSEQTAIASILTDMDAEIAALEEKLAKARQLKQGMMQELLTGKTRLVESSK
jgi:type I restriction enzyme S subunit